MYVNFLYALKTSYVFRPPFVAIFTELLYEVCVTKTQTNV